MSEILCTAAGLLKARAAKLNSALISFILYACSFTTETCQKCIIDLMGPALRDILRIFRISIHLVRMAKTVTTNIHITLLTKIVSRGQLNSSYI